MDESTAWYLDPSKIDTLVILNVIASTFSFLGATFIIATIFIFEEFKTNFAFKLILFVAIGDVINSLGNFCGAPSEGSALCYIQAFLTQFGDIVSFAWVTAIAWVIYNVISREVPPTREDVEKWYKKIHLIIWPITLFLSILPFFSSSYGNDNGLCWIKFKNEKEDEVWGEVWRWFCFYIPLWGSIIYVGVCYYRIWGQLNAKEVQRQDSAGINAANSTGDDGKTTNVDEERPPEVRPSASDVFQDPNNPHHQGQSSDAPLGGYKPSETDITAAHQPSADDNSAPKSGGGTLQRIKFYPFVLFGCYMFSTIRRFAEWGSGEAHVAPFGIVACQVFTSALLGTCNAILYGFTPVVRQKWAEKLCGDKGQASFMKTKSHDPMSDMNSDDTNGGDSGDVR